MFRNDAAKLTFFCLPQPVFFLLSYKRTVFNMATYTNLPDCNATCEGHTVEDGELLGTAGLPNGSAQPSYVMIYSMSAYIRNLCIFAASKNS
jgi:hypothetical protein